MAAHGVHVCRDGWKWLALVTRNRLVSMSDVLIECPSPILHQFSLCFDKNPIKAAWCLYRCIGTPMLIPRMPFDWPRLVCRWRLCEVAVWHFNWQQLVT